MLNTNEENIITLVLFVLFFVFCCFFLPFPYYFSEVVPRASFLFPSSRQSIFEIESMRAKHHQLADGRLTFSLYWITYSDVIVASNSIQVNICLYQINLAAQTLNVKRPLYVYVPVLKRADNSICRRSDERFNPNVAQFAQHSIKGLK